MSTLQPKLSSKPGIWTKIGWIGIFILALLMFAIAGRYLTFKPDLYFPQQKAVYITHTIGIMTHIVGSMLATIIGPLQFLPTIRTGRYRNIHRWLGRMYLVGILFGGIGGLYMAFLAYGGVPTQLGFATLALLWLFTGFMAYKRIRHKNIQSHRRWMLRNYALTFAAVTLRLWLGIFQLAGIEFIVGYMIVAWLSWIPNLIIVEWMLKGSHVFPRKDREVRHHPMA